MQSTCKLSCHQCPGDRATKAAEPLAQHLSDPRPSTTTADTASADSARASADTTRRLARTAGGEAAVGEAAVGEALVGAEAAVGAAAGAQAAGSEGAASAAAMGEGVGAAGGGGAGGSAARYEHFLETSRLSSVAGPPRPTEAEQAKQIESIGRETPLKRWERTHPTEAQLGAELLFVLMAGLVALGCIRLCAKRGGGSTKRTARRRTVEAMANDHQEDLMIRTC